jgi:hypothetical protein
MSRAVTFPILPCPDVDVAVTFYEALGFERTYRQTRPNPYAAVARGDLNVHVYGIDGYDPSTATGNVGIAVADCDALYEAFAAGLREMFGRLPSAGVPRITRPRKRFGTVYGFSVVDPGGNWLRFSNLGDTEEGETKRTGLLRVVDNAARQGDSRGSDADALDVLDRGLARFADAPAAERVEALLYRAEIALRLSRRELAEASFAEAGGLALDASDRARLADDFAHVAELLA